MTHRGQVEHGSVAAPSDRLVVAVDDLLDCRSALRFAVDEALSSRCRIEVLHVPQGEGDDTTSEALEPSLLMVSALSGGKVDATASITRGPVVEVLVGVSRDAALLVVEHRRISPLRRQLVPSIAMSVAGRVQCALVSVPQGWAPAGGSSSWVTVGVDALDRQTDDLVEEAFALADRRGRRLRLVHAWSMSNPYDDVVVDQAVEDDWARAYRARLGDLLSPHLAVHPRVETAVEVEHQDPAKTLLRWSSESDLLLIRRGHLVHPLVDGLGSVSRRLVEDSRCPVRVSCL